MKYIRLFLGVFIGLLLISFVVESIEVILIKLVSGKSFSQLTNPSNHIEYFNVRNSTWILFLKMVYSLLGGIIGGYFAAWISNGLAKTAIQALIIIQISTLFWAGFLSESLSQTGPKWMWSLLILVVPIGIGLGYQRRKKFVEH